MGCKTQGVIPLFSTSPATEAPCTCPSPAHGEAAPRPGPDLALSLLFFLFLLHSGLPWL